MKRWPMGEIDRGKKGKKRIKSRLLKGGLDTNRRDSESGTETVREGYEGEI